MFGPRVYFYYSLKMEIKHPQYRASNTATRDICDVKVGLPLGSMDPSQVQVNNSYAMAIEPPSSSSASARGDQQGQMLKATLQVH